MQIEEILIIKNGSENYGISTENIDQISRVPSLMPLPLRPSGTRGLCAVGGNIVSMVDLNVLLGTKEVNLEASASRIISLNGKHETNALLVSEIYNTVYIDEENIEYIDNNDDAVIAIYKYKDSLVQVISLDLLIKKINKIDIKAKDIHNGKIKEVNTVEEDKSRFLVFAMGAEKFALNIDNLREIILADVKYTEIAGSSKQLLGLITLRESLVAVMDLRLYYGFKGKKSDKNRILIASVGNDHIGLLVDEIIDIKSIFNKDIEYLENESAGAKVSGVIHDTNSLISFFDKSVVETIMDQNRAYIETEDRSHNENLEDQDSSEVIVFKLATKEYAFKVDCVAEIMDIVKSTDVAYTDDNVDGIINIRGQIVPIFSLFKKLKIKAAINNSSKIIVCTINNNKIGFVVDSISDILSVRKDELKEQEDEIFPHVLHLNNGSRLVLSMDIDKVVSGKGI